MHIPEEVLAVLRRSVCTATSLTLPPDKLDRKLYVDVNKVLEAAGGKWDRRTRSHVFERDPRDVLDLAVSTGKIVSKKTELQAFYTPAKLAMQMAALLPNWTPAKMRSLRVLEPSAGHGALLDPLVQQGVNVQNVTCYDVDQDAVNVLNGRGYRASCRDFLSVLDPALVCAFDLVVMNPPFTKGQAVAHVHHALRFPQVGGQLLAIMPPTWESSRVRAAVALRDDLTRSYDWAVQPLPEGSFQEAGTNVKVVLLHAKRLRA